MKKVTTVDKPDYTKDDVIFFSKKLIIKNDHLSIDADGYEASDIVNIINAFRNFEDAKGGKEFTKTKEERIIVPVRKSFDCNKEVVEEYDLRDIIHDTKLPRVTTDFTCVDCQQSVIFINKSDSTVIVRDLKDNTLHRTEALIESIPELVKDGKIDSAAVIVLYNDLLKYSMKEDLTLVSDSKDIIECPICKKEMTIADAVKKFEGMAHEERCPICGGPIERVMSKDGEISICKNNNCLDKIQL